MKEKKKKKSRHKWERMMCIDNGPLGQLDANLDLSPQKMLDVIGWVGSDISSSNNFQTGPQFWSIIFSKTTLFFSFSFFFLFDIEDYPL